MFRSLLVGLAFVLASQSKIYEHVRDLPGSYDFIIVGGQSASSAFIVL
jgi:hypothetical protein